MTTIELEQYIAGRWAPGGGGLVQSADPAHPDVLVAAGAGASAADLDRAVTAARGAQPAWAATPMHERGAILQRAALLLRDAAEKRGAELAREEGKTLAEGIGEVRRAAQILDYAGRAGDREAGSLFESPRPGERILVTRHPLGTVGLITPFNFPIAIPAWKIAPALVYGNAVVWKPADPVPLLAMRLAEALEDAGLPAGVLNLVIGDSTLGRALVAHAGIDAISFTGSTPVGRSIAAAGAARGIPVQAELGGKNAAIVLADADLELAVAQVGAGAFASSGQKCTATSRLIVAEEIADEFLARIAARADGLAVGDPLAPGIDLGPVVSAAARTRIDAGVAEAVAGGATRLTSGTLELAVELQGGHFVRPEVIDCTGVDTSLWNDELFGPVLAVRRAGSVEEAFRLANEGEFGLSAAVFTDSLVTALSAIERIEVGMLHVNSETAGADPHVPFGGAKGSGLGPQEQGAAARDFYTRSTTVYLRGGS